MELQMLLWKVATYKPSQIARGLLCHSGLGPADLLAKTLVESWLGSKWCRKSLLWLHMQQSRALAEGLNLCLRGMSGRGTWWHTQHLAPEGSINSVMIIYLQLFIVKDLRGLPAPFFSGKASYWVCGSQEHSLLQAYFSFDQKQSWLSHFSQSHPAPQLQGICKPGRMSCSSLLPQYWHCSPIRLRQDFPQNVSCSYFRGILICKLQILHQMLVMMFL